MRYLHFNGMTWPAPDKALADLEWTFRYGNPTREDILNAASVISAYTGIILRKTQKDRNRVVEEIRGILTQQEKS